MMLLAGVAFLALAACNKTPKTGPQPVDFSQYQLRVEPVITRVAETHFETGAAHGRGVERATADYGHTQRENSNSN